MSGLNAPNKQGILFTSSSEQMSKKNNTTNCIKTDHNQIKQKKKTKNKK